MAESSSHGLVTLECHHQPRFTPAPPMPGETVYCVWCRDYRTVVTRHQEISLRCAGCKLSRKHGVGGEGDLTLNDAKRLASGHVLRFPTHEVRVTDTNGDISVIAASGQAELPFEDAVRRRTADSRSQAAMLRGAFNRSSGHAEPRSAQA